MKYIIVDPDEQIGNALKKILDTYEVLDFKGRFTTLEAGEIGIREETPNIAFIRMGKSKLNAFKLSCVVRGINQHSKVIFLSSQWEYAVDAFEWEADGFISIPFDEKKIKHLLMRCVKK